MVDRCPKTTPDPVALEFTIYRVGPDPVALEFTIYRVAPDPVALEFTIYRVAPELPFVPSLPQREHDES
jgi:hypothetical protein